MTATFKLIALFSALAFESSAFGNTLCAFSKQDNVQYQKVETPQEIIHQHSISEHNVDANSTEHCSKDSDFCYAFWHKDPINKTIVIVTQGCWDSAGDLSCGFGECIATQKSTKAYNNSKFCCCSGDFCNINVTDGYISPPSDKNEDLNPALQYVEPIGVTSFTIVIVAVAMIVFIIIALITCYMFKFCLHPPKRSKDLLHIIETGTPLAPTFDFDSLKIQNTIGRGRYGTVCHGILHDRAVAVKIFSHQNKQYYWNERDIYTLPHMDHPSLLKYIGSEERIGSEGRPEYLLVLPFSSIGCLQDFLRKNAVDWSHLCRMALSIAQGVAHLHSEFGKGDRIKPCVAHRDLTSRNILMKSDGSCMLCDFGFAIRISGSKYYQNGEEQIAETTSLADVGTLRYMAPEILEGAVNLRDCESSLKQIDVYALGLVMWEIASRCIDLFQGTEVPEYRLPFEAEVGIHPTMEQMQILVTRHKARPLFPDIWKDANPAVRTLKETIEECWDQDAEARLTTLCVEERLAELPLTWERYRAGLCVTSCASSTAMNSSSNQRMGFALNKMQSNSDIIAGETPNHEDVPSFNRERTFSLSGGTTETLLSPSESGTKDITPENGANNAVVSSKVSVPIQPHQSCNSCLEKNLIVQPVLDDKVFGNTLLNKVTKDNVDENFHSYSDGDTNILDSTMVNNNSLHCNDLLSHSIQMCIAAPHLSNGMDTTTTPKQLNVPESDHLALQEILPKSKDDRRWRRMDFFDHKKRTKEGVKNGLKILLCRKSSTANSKEVPEEQQLLNGYPNCSSSNNMFESKFGQINNINCVLASDENKGNDHIIDTEVRVIKSDSSCTVVRPINNTQNIPNGDCIGTVDTMNKNILNENTTIKPVKDVIKKCDQQSVNRDIKPVIKSKRPNSLPLQELHGVILGNDEDDKSEADILVDEVFMENKVSVQIRRKNNSVKRKGIKRVKTPFEIKGRFSLYDDRIMSSQELSAEYSKETVQPVLSETTKFSTSVPLDMNTLRFSKLSSVLDSKIETNKSEKGELRNGCVPHIINQLQIIHPLCDI